MMNNPDSSPLPILYQNEVYSLPGKVLIVVRKWETIAESDRQLLSKILGSVRLTMGAVQIISMEALDFDRVQFLQPEYIISFGASMKEFPARYEIISLQDTKIIQADALSELNDMNKKNLWSVLKQMFSI